VRDWSLATLLAHAAPGFDDAIVFRSLHLVYGVGTIPIAEILAGRARLQAESRGAGRRFVVGTASHCHGLATSLTVRPRR
jgi:hypothetical protein